MLLKNIARILVKYGGNAVGFGVAGDALLEIWDCWNKEKADPQKKLAEVQVLAQQSAGETRQMAADIVLEMIPDQPEEVRQTVATYLNQVPAMVRRSLRRPADPNGTTIPPGLLMTKPEDLLILLPPKPSRFKPGDSPLPGVDWELVELLGVGGFGEVWKARNKYFDGVPPVALKFCTDKEAARTLRHEAGVLNQVMRQGTHPGIVQLRQSYLNAEPPCLEYEFVEGGDLAGLIHDWHRSSPDGLPDRVARLILQLAEVVGFAHRLKPAIVHRDLKPANILVQQAPGGAIGLKVGDFGIGGIAANQAIKELAEKPTWQVTAMATGTCTPLYASPQQSAGKPADPRDDVFSLGVIWYQMLTGNLTVGRPGGFRWREKLTERGVTPAMVKLLERCFEDNPEDRPKDARELRDDLDALTRPPEAVRITCPNCRATLKALATVLGKKIKCPKCTGVFLASTSPPSDQPLGAGQSKDHDKDFARDVAAALEELGHKGSYVKWFERVAPNRSAAWKDAAEKGNLDGMWLYAICLQTSIGAETKPEAAVALLQRVAEKGVAIAQNCLGDCFCFGAGVKMDHVEAVKWYRKAADQGLPAAICALADCFVDGTGVAENAKEAFQLYSKAAESGFPPALYALGTFYHSGAVVNQDIAEAARWYRKAAEQGYAEAEAGLGYCLWQGEGVEQNLAEALQWMKKAADQGEAKAQNYLGICYERGEGVQKNLAEAFRYYQLAADQDEADAQDNLGLCYASGRGVAKNEQEALKWHRLSAEQGYVRAQFNVGSCYHYGRGVKKDLAEAEQWYRKASEQGYGPATKALNGISKKASHPGKGKKTGGPKKPKKTSERWVPPPTAEVEIVQFLWEAFDKSTGRLTSDDRAALDALIRSKPIPASRVEELITLIQQQWQEANS